MGELTRCAGPVPGLGSPTADSRRGGLRAGGGKTKSFDQAKIVGLFRKVVAARDLTIMGTSIEREGPR